MIGSNGCVLIGTVASLEKLTARNGKPWCQILLEISTFRHVVDGSPAREETTTVPVNLFSKLATIALEALKQGDAIAISVRLQGTRDRRGVTVTADQLHLFPNGRNPANPMGQLTLAPRSL
jgi:single-stranded DNA-binding protein